MHYSFSRRALAALALSASLCAQGIESAPDRRPDEGKGPFDRLLIRNVIVIDGTGSPPRGPMNVLVNGNRIARVGTPNVRSDFNIDGTGMYLMPGFVDMHGHAGGKPKNPTAEYPFKLWMGHGITAIRGVPLGQNNWVVAEQRRSDANETVAPRIFNYQRPRALHDVDAARAWVRKAKEDGVQGLKLGAHRPDVMAALIDEAHKLGMGTVAHLAQTGVAQMDAMDAARAGLDSVTHFYGHFEALMRDYVVQPWPVDMNYNDEQMRFGQVARLWDKIHPPGSPEWKAYLNEHLELGTIFNPTFCIYSASRDVMRNRTADWHDEYSLPSLLDFFAPSRRAHGSYWFYWTTADEIAWKNFYRVWMQLVNDYKRMGGRITVGSDSGFIYDTYGFGYIEELEMLQEAGFHPLEVIQAATMNGAKTLHEPMGKPIEFGVIAEGMLADMILVPENPLENLKVLYGNGAVKLTEDSELIRVGGVRYTIKDGIVYDAEQLRADVRAMVAAQKAERAAAAADQGQDRDER